MSLFDDYDVNKERYKLHPKSRITARVIMTVLILVLMIVAIRAVIKLA